MTPLALLALLAAASKGPDEALPAEQIELPRGFRAERLYSVPAEQGSWVAMTFDDRGRVLASDQRGPIFRITPPKLGEGGPAKVEKLDVKLGECQGMLWEAGSLYCVANATQVRSGLYRLRRRPDDGFAPPELLRALSDDHGEYFVGREHGPHGIVRGPDGGLWMVAGNNTRAPETAPGSPYRNYDEDLLLPRRPDGRGHNTGVMAPGGWVARTDRDGESWRIVAGGLRNAYDIAFNHHGELFTYDSDMEWDIGASWYRPTRVNHVVSGAEFGWRYGTGKWPAYWIDSLGSVVDTGLGSPTGIAFGHGARFPARYQRALFLLDWAYGRIQAVHLTPDGASYRGAAEPFAVGRPLPVTDLAIGPDGAMYFTTGGRATRSGLYRITYVGEESTRPVRDLDTPAAARARVLRRRLEALHGREVPGALALAWPHLGSPDRVLRHAARVAVEHQPLRLWQTRALAEPRPEARPTALVALTRAATDPARAIAPADRPALVERIAAALDALPLERLPEARLLDALRAYQLAFVRLGRPGAAAAARTTARLDALYPHAHQLPNRELAQLLIYLDAPDVVGKTMKLLADAEAQEDQVHYAFVLRNAKRGWSFADKQRYFGWIRRAATAMKGGASWAQFIEGIKRDALANFTDEDDRRKLADLLDTRPTPPEGEVKPRSFVRDWRVEDLQDALAEVGRGRSFERGRATFEAGMCLRCHRFGREGSGAGPDLTSVGNRFSARELLEAIVSPSLVISDQYQSTQVVTKGGEAHVGAVIEETADHLVLRPSPLADLTVTVRKADVATRGLSDVSSMPEGLLATFTREEILDLLAYVRSAGRPEDPAFRPAGR